MNIFSEIYGAYFRTVEKILSISCKNEISRNEIYDIIRTEAFRDSMLFIPQKLIPDKDDLSDWGLLKSSSAGGYRAVTKDPPPKIVTALQKSWLKAKLSDPKFRLFFTDDTLSLLERRLENVKPLFSGGMFRSFDVFTDGDDFLSESYKKNFRTVLAAVRSREILQLEYVSKENRLIRGRYLPLKLEYSRKNDKFRLYCLKVKHDKGKNSDRISGRGIFNLGRIRKVCGTGVRADIQTDMEEYFRRARCKEPVQIEISDERNGIERFMLEFASFEKRAEFDSRTGKCTALLWYDKADETELLIRLLGFGPVIKILAPEEFRQQAAQRVFRQYELLFGGKENESPNEAEDLQTV